jgi:flavin reductase (DIM6/NTAB) family NADH-FMN oxidoreductase RutF
MKEFIPSETLLPKLSGILMGSVAPRPIAFASTIDKDGNPNLSPFSFFNLFGSNPATLVFSPSRRGRDNTTKDTFNNVKEIPEVVINVVTYQIVEQVSLASNEFSSEIDEFVKSGLSAVKSDLIRPFRVKESPVQYECLVKQVIETGTEGGAGNLVVCEIVKIHVDENILDEDGTINPEKVDLVGRMGKDFYCRASGNALFQVAKPGLEPAIGIDQLPDKIKHSKVFTGNDLGKLGSLKSFPSEKDIQTAHKDLRLNALKAQLSSEPERLQKEIQLYAKELLKNGEPLKALSICLI